MIGVLDKVVAISIYGVIFFIPFAKAGIEICATVAIIAWAIKKITNYKLQITNYFPHTPLNKPIGVLFVISFISMLFSVNLGLSLEGVFLKLFEYVLLFFVCYDFFSQKEERDRRTRILLTIIMISALLIFSDAIFQWIMGRDFLRCYTALGGRLRASFKSATNLAGWLIVIIPLLCATLFTHDMKKKLIALSIFFLVITGIILLGMTFSRGAWLGFLSSSCLIATSLLINKTKRVKLFACLAIVCLLMSVLGGVLFFEPIKKRLATFLDGFEKAGFKKYVWREALYIIEDFPLLGTGPNTYAYIGPRYKILEHTGYYPHNSYLHMAAETGLLGLGAFLWIIWRFFYLGIKKVKESGDILLLGIMGGLCAFLVHSFFNPNLFALQLVVLFWVMLGVGTARIMKMDTVS